MSTLTEIYTEQLRAKQAELELAKKAFNEISFDSPPGCFEAANFRITTLEMEISLLYKDLRRVMHYGVGVQDKS